MTRPHAMPSDLTAALTPKLRFVEFRNGPGWETKTLGSLATISTEKVGDNACVPMSITSGVGLVSQMEKFGRVIAGSSYKNYLLLKKNDFAYNKSATKDYPEGFIALYSGDALAAVPNSIFTCFCINGDSPVPQYLNYLFLGNLHGQWLRKFIEVGARAHGSLSIDEDDLLALPVPLPGGKTARAEQQKIAECLRTLDELIGAESQKLDALKAHKKGLMQQLFPREGETMPPLRFPEFQSAPEWQAYTLSQVATYRRGSFPQPYGLPEWFDDINGMPFVQVFDVGEDLRLKPKTKKKISKLASDQSVFIPKDTIVITLQGSIGRVAITQYDAFVDRTLLLFESFLKPTEKIFFAYTIQLLFEIEKEKAPGKVIKTITKEALSDFVVRIPSVNEQHRIATCLTSLDEENIFIWCLFMALCERVIDGHPSYDWVKFFYIDDPISSLDDNNAIAVASDLAKLLRKAKDRTKLETVANIAPSDTGTVLARSIPDPIKVVISSHHALFFNVVCNELKPTKHKRYFLHRPSGGTDYTLRGTDDTPFFHHVAMLSELRKAADSGTLYTYHFNLLRSILEKTATFFGKKDFSECLAGVEDEALYSRALNLLSHGRYSLYEPVEMLEDNKQLFRDILDAFLAKHAFDLPALLNEAPAAAPTVPPA